MHLDLKGIEQGWANALLIRDQWYRNADAGLAKLTTGRNVNAGLTFSRHSGIY
jgi:hypothetical protein